MWRIEKYLFIFVDWSVLRNEYLMKNSNKLKHAIIICEDLKKKFFFDFWTNANSTENGETDYLDELMPYIYAYMIAGCISIIAILTSISCWTWSAERQVIFGWTQ